MALIVLGCGGKSIAGKYHIEQDGSGFGPGADKIELSLKDDKSFDVSAGPLKMLEGTWTFEKDELKLSTSSETISASYHLKDGKLIPSVNGKDVSFWRWASK